MNIKHGNCIVEPTGNFNLSAAELNVENRGLNDSNYKFLDLFDLSEIQDIQDRFSLATGVASIITEVDGTPITNPSNFSCFCSDIVRKTEKGLKNCMLSDSIIGSPCSQGPRIQRCLSGGLIDGGVSIIVGGRHIANWLAGQVLDAETSLDDLLAYADEIGADREAFSIALRKVTRMSKQQFSNICDYLFLTAKQLSSLALKNTLFTLEMRKREIAEKEIRQLNSGLEKMVLERTCQLEEANTELEEINAQLEEEISERLIIEKDLKNSIEEIEDLYNNSPCGYHSLDKAGVFIRINDTELHWLGYTREEIIGKLRFPDVISKDSLKVFLKNYESFMQRGYVKDLEFDMIRKDGSLFPVLLNATAVRDSTGNFIMSRSTVYDITERKKAEIDLQELNSTLENMVLERTNQLQETNSELEETNAMLKEEIAERTKIQEALTKSEELYRSVYENSPLAFGIWDNEFKFVDWNKRAEELFGWTKEEVLGKRFVDFLIPPEIRPAVTNVAQNLLATGIERITANDNITKDGRILFCEWHNTLLHDGTGNLIGAISLGLDKTESIEAEKAMAKAREQTEAANNRLQKINAELEETNAVLEEEIAERMEFEEALKKSKFEAEQANRAKSQFLANMSHEIRTPMNGIIGMTNLAIMTDLNEEQLEYLTIVKSSANSLLRVLNDILDYSKIEADKIDLEKHPFDIRKTISEVVDLFAVAAKQKKLFIRQKIAYNIPQKLIGDSVRLRQILSNIVGNAVKFTNQGGIVIEVKCENLDERGVKLYFQVSDTGIGISPDNIDKLFKRFSQVDDSYTKQFGGSGLGLAISKKLVEMMDGQIGVDSREAVGSKFFFTAIFENEDESQLTSRENTNDLNLHIKQAEIKKVLLVEDDEISRRVALAFLKKKGLAVATAENGKEAIDIYSKEKFDLILMDISMPYLDGLSATSIIRLKEKDSCGHIPIIAMTAYALTGDAEKCLNAGMDDYIAKPIDIWVLDSKLDKWLKG